MTTDRKIFIFSARRGIMAEIEYPGVAQLVGRDIWDVEVGCSSHLTRTKAPRSIASGGFFLVYCGAGFEGDADFLRVLVICCRYAYNKKTFSLLDYIIIPKKGAYISMGFPSFFFIKYKLSDLVEVTALQNMTIAELRNKVEILVIDDQDFAAEEYLIKNGFRIVHKRDIDNIRDVSAYAVVLCDIRGVGKNLGSTKEGAFVIKEIKAHYPAKQVIAYTGSSYDPAYNEYMNLADAVISKGISIEDWTALVDEQIQKAVDPIYQWERLRKHLLECGVSTAYVAKLEDKYVRAIKAKNFEDLTKLADGTNDKARGLIADFTASVCAKVILGSI